MIGILVFGLLILSVICLWLLIENRKSWKFLIWFIPVLLLLTSSTYFTYTSILGYAKISMPKEGMYLQHHVAEPNWIYLWVLEKRNTPRAYTFSCQYLLDISPNPMPINGDDFQKLMAIGHCCFIRCDVSTL